MDWIITPEGLRDELRERPGAITLIDCREPEEWEICRIDGATLIPLGEMPGRAGSELQPGAELIVYCHHGVRSLNAVMILRSMGFMKTRSLEGGIDLWAERIEPEMPRY